ncbi:MHO_1590 family protein [Mycoplasma nasistruthionis]|uniref:MHO_1590 family protein n=1 Tax=Mycoplasma nasistruthionis TaxID=353852 RepID=UPI001ABF402D|nr:hypothetical protein [Mycoplasma nasistruthionis]
MFSRSILTKPLLILFSLGFFGAIGVGGYFLNGYIQKQKSVYAKQKSEKTTITEDVSKKPQNKVAVFPVLDSGYFDQFVQSNEVGKRYLDKNLVNAVVKDILRRIKITNGDLYFDYEIISDQHLQIYFKYKYKEDYQEKIYDFILASAL